MSAMTWIGVALVGGVAALARVLMDRASAAALARVLSGPAARLSAGTFVVNVTGSFLLGLLDGVALSGAGALIIATAGVGTYTTFSTWMLQSEVLATTGQRLAAVVNVVASVVIGFGAVALGRLIGTVL